MSGRKCVISAALINPWRDCREADAFHDYSFLASHITQLAEFQGGGGGLGGAGKIYSALCSSQEGIGQG